MRLQDYYPTLASEGINDPASFQKIDSNELANKALKENSSKNGTFCKIFSTNTIS